MDQQRAAEVLQELYGLGGLPRRVRRDPRVERLGGANRVVERAPNDQPLIIQRATGTEVLPESERDRREPQAAPPNSAVLHRALLDGRVIVGHSTPSR